MDRELEANKWAQEILSAPAFGLAQGEKEKIYIPAMKNLMEYHRISCRKYRKMLKILGYRPDQIKRMEDIPMIPVSAFKDFFLSSITEDRIFKTVTSSGTTGQTPSRIVLDRRTADLQQRALVRIVEDFIGKKRVPMMIVDTEKVFQDRNLFSARGAGILGFSIFASERCFILDENMEPDMKKIEDFLERNREKSFLIFGFTSVVWSDFYKKIKQEGKKLDLSKAYLIHGGGWKKMTDQAVSPEVFAESLREQCNIVHLSNYYGMAEQTGTIYMECEYGHLHVSSYSDVLIRNMKDFSLCRTGEEGVIQVISPIALSYPGHSLLTEDKGYVEGEDDCPCKRKGKYFKVTGRIRQAEIRGCSDVYGD